MLRIFRLFENYWKELLIAFLIIILSFFWWKDHRGLIDAYDASVESYETRIKTLKKSYENEALRKEQALSDFKKRLGVLESERTEFIEELDNKKAERKVEIVRMKRADPDGFILKIETQFGFEHVE